ncbi:MAG: RHS repeat-associated core domain-containing protein [Bacteroidota bacterium]
MRIGLGQTNYDIIVAYFLGQSSRYIDSMNLSEWHLYGSSRLGIYQTSINMAYRNVKIIGGVTTDSTSATVAMPSYTLFDIQRGAKRYELTNHLGNVLVVVSDKKIQQCSSSVVTYYVADVVSANDYSAFGAPLASRSYAAPNTKYRFGFNGKEKDNETYSDGGEYEFGGRIYNSRLGVWLSLDPEMMSFPHESHYSFCSDNPIIYLDPDGKKKIITHIFINEKGDKVSISVTVSDELMSKTREVASSGFGLETHSTTEVYDWYDINETVVHRFENGKEVSTNTFVTAGELRTTTIIKSSLLADYLVDDEIENTGYTGIMWTSSNGKGQETKKFSGKGSFQIENIDNLVGTIAGMGTALQMGSGGLKIPEALLKEKAVVEALDVLAKTIDKGTNVILNTLPALNKANGSGLAKDASDTKAFDTMCTGGCGTSYHGDYPGVERNENKDTLRVIPKKN